MEGVSFFGATPCFSVIPAGGFVIPTSRITSDAPSVAGEVFMPEEVHVQGFVRSSKGASASIAATPAINEHLDNIGEFEFPTSFILLVVVCCIFQT